MSSERPNEGAAASASTTVAAGASDNGSPSRRANVSPIQAPGPAALHASNSKRALEEAQAEQAAAKRQKGQPLSALTHAHCS